MKQQHSVHPIVDRSRADKVVLCCPYDHIIAVFSKKNWTSELEMKSLDPDWHVTCFSMTAVTI